MNRKTLVFFLSLLLFLAPSDLLSQKKKTPKDWDPKYKKWLEEEVVYIINPKEKEVFLQLETDRERDRFSEAFWKQRDPTPNIPENEFKQEHYRRLNHANQFFGKDSPGAGWRTDMGRVYIILGEPRSIDRFENMSEVYPLIIWFYEARPEAGLLEAFNVVFFKKGGVGEYELYSPVQYGPQQLLIHYKGDPADYLAAYNELFKIEPTIAYVSLTLIPGETAFSMSPSIASEVLIRAKIPAASYQQVKASWAEKLLAYKDTIEVEYSTNYIDSDFYLSVIRANSGVYFVHYLIEPSRLTLEQYGNRFLTNLEVNGKVSDLEDRTIFQYERTIPIEFNREQMNSIKGKLFSFQDMFPLIEGNYKLSLLLKNNASKEFTSAEKDVFIPSVSASPRMSSLILANRVVRNSEYRGKGKPFLFGDIQLVPSPKNDFAPQDHLYVFFQINGLTADLEESGTLSYVISAEDKEVRSFRKNLKDYHQPPDFLEDISLVGLAPAYYKIRVSLSNKDREEILFEKADFYISSFPHLPRPWLLSLPVSSPEDPAYLNILGNQYLNKRDLVKARPLLEEAYRKNAESVTFALDFCRGLLAQKDYLKIKEIARSFLGRPEKHEFYAILGQSCQALSEWGEAISHYKNYLTYFGTNIQILNSIGECYYQLGNKKEALTAWEKSLELNPKQENLKKLVESLKEKK